jgi:hypothetical protein
MRLDALGFVWDVLTTQWDRGFSALQTFYEREGHCRVPLRHREGDYLLGQWVSAQRSRKDVLQSERRMRLDALGFVWSLQKK